MKYIFLLLLIPSFLSAQLKESSDSNKFSLREILQNSSLSEKQYQFAFAEESILAALGLIPAQIATVRSSHLEGSRSKIYKLALEIKARELKKTATENTALLALCYHLLGDSSKMKQEQNLLVNDELMMSASMILNRLAKQRFENFYTLEEIEKKIKSNGGSEELDLSRAEYLLLTEKVSEARALADKYYNRNKFDVTILLLKSKIEMAAGNIEQMNFFQQRALAVNPDALKSR